MKRFLSAIFFLCVALLPPPSSADEMTDDFTWFSTLGYPDVKGLKPVRFIHGFSMTGGEKTVKPEWEDGFLLKDSPEKFKVLTFNFAAWEIPRKDDFFKNQEYRFEPLDLAAKAEARLEKENAREPDQSPFMLQAGPHFRARTELFVLAWACWRQGRDDLAARLYEAAQKKDSEALPFRQKLERDLGEFEMWRITLDFGDPSITRTELLEKLRQLQKNFPHSEYVTRAKSASDMLEKMITEDDAHPKLTDAEIAKLPPEAQAKEWIFRLRDQNGQQISQPGWVNVFAVFDVTAGKLTSPAHRLQALGDAAVPSLIEALGDTRFTRSVGYGRNFVFSHRVLTIGEASLQIIESIASRQFRQDGNMTDLLASDGDMSGMRGAVEEWWKNRQSKGEMGEMAEETARGDSNSAKTGEKLLAKYPAAAATPILTGAAAATDSKVRSELIRLVGKLKDDRAQPFLLKEVKEGTMPGSRAQAAYELAKQGNFDDLPLLADEWLKKRAPSGNPMALSRQKLITVLAVSDSPVGVQTLSAGLMQHSPYARKTVLENLDPARLVFSLMAFGDSQPPDKRAAPPSAATQTAIETLLAGELEDTGVQYGFDIPVGNSSVVNHRLCDYAAWLLAARWPDRYQFDAAASFPVRERQRIICLNTWRKGRGLDPLPVPPPPARVKPEDAGKVVQVVFAGGGLKAPDAVQKLFAATKGRGMNGALFNEFVSAYLANAGDSPLSGFVVEAVRSGDGTGIILVASPVERVNPTRKPDQWQAECRMQLPNGKGYGGTLEQVSGKLDNIPADGPLDFLMIFAPPQHAEDVSL